MRWPWQREKTPSALAQTTALINELIEEHQQIVQRHHEILDQSRAVTEDMEDDTDG